MEKLIIYSTGGFAREIAWLAERVNEAEKRFDILGFIDDNEALWGKQVGGYPVLGGCECAAEYKDASYVCAIGASAIRKKCIMRLESVIRGAGGTPKYATLIDPSVAMSSSSVIGEGSMICAKNVITVDATIGRHTAINLSCTVGHDAVIGDFAMLYPSVNVSGCVTIGECVEVGTGAQIIQGKHVGHDAIIGAGAVVVRDIPECCTAVGAPAKPIKFHNEK